ncbi:MAPEG family protein [Agrobacterium sp. ES01]|uniref:MAPEG family protein n=1 Tax=Agrobacterium sp. ES01 TaxID=3420714 RepID=UPI003D0E020E
MDPSSADAAQLLIVLAGSVILLVFHVLLQGGLATRELGVDWNAGPRDGNQQPKGKLPGRAARASENYRETYPAFISLAAALFFTGDVSGLGIVGAWIWFLCRLVYIPLYLAGIAYIRSLVWLASLLGLLLMIIGVFL